MNSTNKPSVTRFNAASLIQQAAKDGRIFLTEHATAQMQKRRILSKQVYSVLKEGSVSGVPELDDYGNWKARFVKTVAGRRIGVIAVLDIREGGNRAITVTAFYEWVCGDCSSGG